MTKKIITIAVVLVASCIILMTSCYKVVTVDLQSNEEVTRTVSLADDITPIFSQSCSISGCHNSGGIRPDLTVERLYTSLINGNYVNMDTPENSEIYLWMTGKRGTAMPVGAANNPSNINQLVLAWIKQGAENN
ncbi:MAG: hypothetical protein ACXWCR_11235 [Flavitalea sp.]